MNRLPRCCRGRKLLPEMAQAAKINTVLSDGNRLRILCLLKDGERCVCEIWRHLALPQNLASHHLKVLSGVGLLRSKKDGLRVFYSLNKPALRRHITFLNGFLK